MSEAEIPPNRPDLSLEKNSDQFPANPFEDFLPPDAFLEDAAAVDELAMTARAAVTPSEAENSTVHQAASKTVEPEQHWVTVNFPNALSVDHLSGIRSGIGGDRPALVESTSALDTPNSASDTLPAAPSRSEIPVPIADPASSQTSLTSELASDMPSAPKPPEAQADADSPSQPSPTAAQQAGVRIQSLEQQNHKLWARVAHLEAELERSQQHLQIETSRLEEWARQQYTQAQEQAIRLDHQSRHQDTLITKQREALDAAAQRLREQDDQIHQQTQELIPARERLAQLSHELDLSQQNLSISTQIVREQDEQIRQQTQELIPARTRIVELTQTLDLTQDNLAGLSQQLQDRDRQIAQQTEELLPAREQLTQLNQDLELARQTQQTQQIGLDTLTEQLQASQVRVAQLERECALTKQHYDEQVQLVRQAENSCKDLRSRLHRQQRYTLQFKAALEKCLEMPAQRGLDPTVSDDLQASERETQTAQSFVKIQPVQPWSAPSGLLSGSDSTSSDDLTKASLPAWAQMPQDQDTDTSLEIEASRNLDSTENLADGVTITADADRAPESLSPVSDDTPTLVSDGTSTPVSEDTSTLGSSLDPASPEFAAKSPVSYTINPDQHNGVRPEIQLFSTRSGEEATSDDLSPESMPSDLPSETFTQKVAAQDGSTSIWDDRMMAEAIALMNAQGDLTTDLFLEAAAPLPQPALSDSSDQPSDQPSEESLHPANPQIHEPLEPSSESLPTADALDGLEEMNFGLIDWSMFADAPSRPQAPVETPAAALAPSVAENPPTPDSLSQDVSSNAEQSEQSQTAEQTSEPEQTSDDLAPVVVADREAQTSSSPSSDRKRSPAPTIAARKKVSSFADVSLFSFPRQG